MLVSAIPGHINHAYDHIRDNGTPLSLTMFIYNMLYKCI